MWNLKQILASIGITLFTQKTPTLEQQFRMRRAADPDARNGKPIVVNNVTVQPVNRLRADIQLWRNALIAAEGHSQQRSQLFDLYDDILLDGHLMDAVRKRKSAITNSTLTFTAKGKEQEDISRIVNTTFFEKLLEEAMNSRFWGHSLLELFWPAPGQDAKGETHLIPRKHVKPRFGIVTETQYGHQGISYRDTKLNHIIEVGDDEDLGILLQAAQYVIYKRGGFGDWAEYAEVFGMPFRWAEYDNETNRPILEEALEKAGSAGYAVAPSGAKLQFLSNSSSASNQVFRELWQACNEEISVTILGNTMTTTEARSSGYAQSKTHMESQESLHLADRRFILRILNEKLTPYLAALGYKTRGGTWAFVDDEKLSLKDRLDIDLKVASKVPVGASYWYERYGIPKPDPSDVIEPDTEPEPKEPNGGGSKKKPSGGRAGDVPKN